MRRLFIFLFTAGIAAAAPAGKVFVGFTAANAWETGFTGRITITNQTSWTIYDWSLEFELGHPIKKIWNGRVASATGRGKVKQGNRIVLRASAASWEDGDLLPGEKATIEFVGEGASPKLPARGKLNGTPIVFNKASVAPPPLAPRQGNRWPAQVFAPYVDTTLWPPFNFTVATQEYGLKFYTLAFIVAKGSNNPAPSWGGYHLVSKRWLLPEINAIRTAGGEVRVSFGGATGTGLAAACKTPAQLQAAYQVVINTYGLTHIDFDVEGHWLAEAKSIERRARAIVGLQAQARRAKRPLHIWYTLPVVPSGLTREGAGVLRSALRHRVDIAGVNIMAMNYGKAQAPKPTTHMGAYTIQAATSLHAQLKMLHREAGVPKTDAQLWAMIGLTPMLGHNDVKPEIFTLGNAREVLAFARQKKIGLLSCWSANRDRPLAKPSANWASPKHTGIKQEVFGFSKIFHAYGGK